MIDALAARGELAASSSRRSRVELAHHVVEQHQRRRVARSPASAVALGQQQREQRQTLLALGAVGAQLAPVAGERELVAVRAVAGEAALEVARRGARRSSAASSSASAACERGR